MNALVLVLLVLIATLPGCGGSEAPTHPDLAADFCSPRGRLAASMLYGTAQIECPDEKCLAAARVLFEVGDLHCKRALAAGGGPGTSDAGS